MHTLTTCTLAATLGLLLAGCGGPAAPVKNADEALLHDDAKAAPPVTSSPALAKARTAIEAGDFARARVELEALLKTDAKNSEGHFYLGVCLEQTNDRAGAEKSYREALRLAPSLEAAAGNLGALLLDASRFDEAAKVLSDAAAKNPESAALQLNLAIALASQQDTAGASRAFEQAVKRAPKDPMAHLTFGHWLGVWKQADKAADELRNASALAAGNVDVLASVADEQRKAGAFADCITTFDRVLAKKRDAAFLTNRALCKLGAKDDAGATADLDAAVKLEAGYAPAQFYLGGRHASAGHWKEAVAAFEAYLKLAPGGPMAQVAKDRLKLAKQKAGGK